MSKPDRDPLPFISYPVTNWLSDTADLPPEHYRLMAHAWLRGSRLPVSVARLASLAGITPQELSNIWPDIAAWFQVTPDGDEFVMLTIAESYARAVSGREKHKRGAAATNRKRWGGNSEPLSKSLSASNSESLSESLNSSDSDSPSSSSLSSSCSPHRH